jgi:hypothetical protein
MEKSMRALSIRQPFAELILRGIKTAELRSRPTRIIGERFYIYAAKQKLPVDSCQLPVKTWSEDLGLPHDLPEWMIELAAQIRLIDPDEELPRGVIVGSAVIEKVEPVASCQSSVNSRSSLPTVDCRLSTIYRWHLTDVKRLTNPRKPARQPQPVWFRPF